MQSDWEDRKGRFLIHYKYQVFIRRDVSGYQVPSLSSVGSSLWWWENEFRRRKLVVAFVDVTFLVCLLTLASSAGRDIMKSEVAGSILTVFPIKRKQKGFSHVQEPVKLI